METSLSGAQNSMTWGAIENDWIYSQNFSGSSTDSETTVCTSVELYVDEGTCSIWNKGNAKVYISIIENHWMNILLSNVPNGISMFSLVLVRSSPLWKLSHRGPTPIIDMVWGLMDHDCREQILGTAPDIPLLARQEDWWVHTDGHWTLLPNCRVLWSDKSSITPLGSGLKAKATCTPRSSAKRLCSRSMASLGAW